MIKVVFSILSVFCCSIAGAAERQQAFTIPNPGVDCEVGTASRSAGFRYIQILGDFPQSLREQGIPTRVKDGPMTVDTVSSCNDLKAIPAALEGSRELWVQRLEYQGKCNAIVIEKVSVSLGKDNPTLSTKTAWPVVGDDLGRYSSEICQLTEADFEDALDQAL